jgi:hypothetical protein
VKIDWLFHIAFVSYIEKGQFPNVSRHFGVMRCYHCDDAPCVEICRTHSLYRVLTESLILIPIDVSASNRACRLSRDCLSDVRLQAACWTRIRVPSEGGTVRPNRGASLAGLGVAGGLSLGVSQTLMIAPRPMVAAGGVRYPRKRNHCGDFCGESQ